MEAIQLKDFTIIDTSKHTRRTGKYRNAYKDEQNNKYLDCSHCWTIKPIERFSRQQKGFMGRKGQCKDCQSKYAKKWFAIEDNAKKARENSIQWAKENPEHARELINLWKRNNIEKVRKYKQDAYWRNVEKYRAMSREWARNNLSKVRQANREWQIANKERVALNVSRRKAIKMSLPNTLTFHQREQLMKIYNYSCALTGSTENINIDHVIPLITGHGGTIYENLLPLSGSLNRSKHTANVFEWAEKHYERFGFTMDRFNIVMEEVASRSNMTLEEYKEYVYWCFDNKIDVLKGVTV